MLYKTVFVTERSERHQQAMRDVTPPEIDLIILHVPDRDTLKHHLKDAIYLISERHGIIDADLLDSAPKLKMILRLGFQTHDIDLESAKERNIIVTYWSQASVIRVAEHCIMQMLVLLKNSMPARRIALESSDEWGASKRTDENTFSYNWSGLQNVQGLGGKIIGILGFGEIGTELARRLIAWDVTILYNKRHKLPESVEQQLQINYADSETVFQQSDVLVNLLPYSQQTDTFINSKRLMMMKSTAILVSVGSGSIIDEQALALALKNREIAGIALDTYEYEPLLADNPLVQFARKNGNILLTPHIAAGTMSNLDERRQHYSNILRHINGEALINRLA